MLTPNLDRLAQDSLVLTDAVSNCPLCSPFRAMLMTGTYPPASGVTENCSTLPEAASSYLRPGARCISDVLAEVGYDLGYIGKWHLDRPSHRRGGRTHAGTWDTYTPPSRRHGFSFWYAYGIHDNHLAPHYWIGDAPEDRPTTVQAWSPEHEANVAIAYLRDREGRWRREGHPFALFVAMNPPHPPWDLVPDRYLARYRHLGPEDLLVRPNVDLGARGPEVAAARKFVSSYFAAITGVDEQVGRILRCLDE